MRSTNKDRLSSTKNRWIDRLALYNPKLASDIRDIQLPWYEIKNAMDEVNEDGSPVPDPDRSDVYIYDEIGGSFGVDAQEFVKEINAITSPQINVHINSPGGSLFDSIAIYNALVKHRSRVVTYVDALAASGASIIALAGDEVVMMVGSQMMIHDALGMETGNARDHQAMATFLNRQSDNIAGIYRAKAGGEVSDWRDLMLAETWMFANEAVDLRLADKVYTPPKPAEEDDNGDESTLTTRNALDVEPDIPIEQRMRIRHDVSNMPYKHAGREVAPNPLNGLGPSLIGEHEPELVQKPVIDIPALTNAIREGFNLFGKVN